MRSITKFFIERPTIANLCVLLIVALGAMRLAATQTTHFPKSKVRFVDVAVPYPGATPEQVEEGIVLKVEEELKGIPGVDRVTARSVADLGTLAVELTEDAEANEVLARVKNAVDKINTFPRGVEPPVVEEREVKDLALAFAIVGDVSLQTKKDLADRIERDLLAVPGISDVELGGALAQEIEVAVGEAALRAYDLTFADVAGAVAAANLETFGGELKTGTRNVAIVADERGYFARDLHGVVVRAGRDGEAVTLGEVATLTDQFVDRPGERYLGGEPTVVVSVFTTPAENILDNAAAARAYLGEFNATHEGVALTVVEDGSEGVTESIAVMTGNGVAGFVLVLLVLALFLDKYLAFWVALKIPVAIVGMFLLAGLQDLTINVVSLFAFVIVLGILVDDGVVVGENILQWYQRLRRERADANGGAEPTEAEDRLLAKTAALEGTMEVVTPVLISLSTTAAAFAMFLFLPTQTGEFFGEVGFVVIATLVVAAVESFFFLPSHLAHSRALRASNRPSRLERLFNGSFDWFNRRLYQPAFGRLVLGGAAWPYVTLALFVVALGASFTLSRGFTFFPNLDDKAMFIELDLPPGTPVEVTTARLTAIQEAAYCANDSLREATGRDLIPFVEVLTGPQPNQGRLKVTFVNSDTRELSSFQLTEAIRQQAAPIPEALNLVYGIGSTVAVFGKPVSVALRGSDLEALRGARDDLKDAMLARADVKDVSDTDLAGVREVNVRLTPAGERLGFTLAEVMNQVRAAFFGVEAQSLQRGDEEVEVWVRYPEAERRDERQLADMRIRSRAGGSYPLSEIAELDYATGNLVINRLEGQREIRVEANVADALVSAPAVIAELEAGALAEIAAAYPSVRYSVEGQNRDALKMGAGAGVVMPVVLLVMLGLVVVAFNSFSQALLTFALYPFALIGVMVGHWVHDTPLNVFSLIGTIALIGVFTNNSLVFVDTFNQLIAGTTKGGRGPASELSFGDSLREAAASRFRPIVMTTLTTVAGLAPLLASNSLTAQFLKGPAIAMAYGLAYGLFNSLLLLPAMIVMVNGWRRGLAKLTRKPPERRTPERVEPAVRSKGYTFEGSAAAIALLATVGAGGSALAQAGPAPAAPVLPLREAVALTLAQNPQLRALDYDREISRNNVDPAVAGQRPTVELRGGVFGGYADFSGETVPLGPPGESDTGIEARGERYGVQVQPEASWLVYDGGRGRERLAQLRLLDEATAAGIAAAREATVAGLTDAYLGAVALDRQLRLAGRNVDLTRARLDRSASDELFGASSALRTLRIEADLAADSSAYHTLALELANVKRALNQLMGRDVETAFALEDPDLREPRALAYDSLLAALLTGNEELLTARAQTLVNERAEALAQSAFRPTLQLYGNAGYVDQVDRSNFLQESRVIGAEAGVRLSYTLYDGGRRDVERQNAALATAKSRAEAEARRSTLERDLRQAYARRADLIGRVRRERATLPTFERAYRESADAAALGQATATQVREAQLGLLAARTRVATQEVDVARAEVELLRLTGELVR